MEDLERGFDEGKNMTKNPPKIMSKKHLIAQLPQEVEKLRIYVESTKQVETDPFFTGGMREANIKRPNSHRYPTSGLKRSQEEQKPNNANIKSIFRKFKGEKYV